MFGRITYAGALSALLLLSSCASAPPRAESWDGPAGAAPYRVEHWNYPLPQASVLATTHYRLHSDLTASQNLPAAGQLLEGAYHQYSLIAGFEPRSAVPMNGYLFSTRAGWSAFTKANTGEDAVLYLQVSRGAYTVNDWFVAYWLGENTWPVVAHEGWHQFVARHFAGRLPPALEEGLACLFENVRWQGQLPRWNLRENPSRLRALRMAQERRLLLPLEHLLRLHAGEMVGRPPQEVQAFYAQNWALARYLLEGEGGRYRIGLERLFADTAAGRVWLPPQTHLPYARAWNPELAPPVLEHYLGVSLADMEPEFRRYVRELAGE